MRPGRAFGGKLILVALIILAYLCGSIPVGVIVGKAFGFDPRTVGSKNIGMTNVARAGGKIPAALTFAGDLLKGLIPVLIAQRFEPAPSHLRLVALAAFVGAIASVFLRLRGGRGVATALGVWLGLAPIAIAIALAVFVAVLALSRIMSLASLGAAMSLPAAVAVTHSPRPYVLLAIVMSALVVLRHRENIQRLISGTERKIGAA
ncbi:MAG TPA: glycerol-3-phosphate 1-O-acyltransferase PlsY [Candidatus Binataceae bacterium]|nr:glycerol-3-phosphate 1-O-acyltransferase PlsY [Candidatus Binataceae bacterium]